MKPVDTRRVRAILLAAGCEKVGTEGSHEKWRSPGGRSVTIVTGEKQQSPGLVRVVQTTFEEEFGQRWLERALRK